MDTIVAVLSVGELDTDLVRGEYDALLNTLRDLGVQLIVAEPVADKEATVQAARELLQKNPCAKNAGATRTRRARKARTIRPHSRGCRCTTIGQGQKETIKTGNPGRIAQSLTN